MQFSTFIHCQLPIINCLEHNIKSAQAPWANKQSGFTLMFKAFAIQVLLASKSVESARKSLRLNWKQVALIKRRAVDRGLARRSLITLVLMRNNLEKATTTSLRSSISIGEAVLF